MSLPQRRSLLATCVAASLLAPGTARAQADDDPPLTRAPPPTLEPPAPPTPEPPAAPTPEPPAPLAPAPSAALAAPPARFGSPGQWVVSGSSSMGLSSQTFSNSNAVFSSASFAPTVDWFVARNVSLGLIASVSYSDNKGYGADSSLVDTKGTAVRVGPRLGVNLPLGRAVSLWPMAAVGFEWVSQSESVVSGTSSSVAANPLGYPSSRELGPWIELDVLLLWHLAPHFFVGVGPGVFHGFGHVQGGPEVGGQETEVSGGLVVGGWFGGARAVTASEAPAPTDARPVRRFGLDGDVVLSSELNLGGSWMGYGGSSSSSSSGGLTAGVDYFLADHFSIGAAVSGSIGSTTGVDATTGGTVTSQRSGLGLTLRTGVDIPLGDLVSVWPRASVSFSEDSLTEQETTTLRDDENIVTVGVYAPVLVHPSTHFFVGFGPSAYHDLSHSVSVNNGPTGSNASTTLGAGLIVGGWL